MVKVELYTLSDSVPHRGKAEIFIVSGCAWEDNMAAAVEQERRLRHLVEANARRIPVLEKKLKVLLEALSGNGGGEAGVNELANGSKRGTVGSTPTEEGRKVDLENDGDPSVSSAGMLSVLETRIANQQAEWEAQNKAMERKLAEIEKARTQLKSGRFEKSRRLDYIMKWLWKWFKEHATLTSCAAILILFVVFRRRRIGN